MRRNEIMCFLIIPLDLLCRTYLPTDQNILIGISLRQNVLDNAVSRGSKRKDN